jgi:hypothetical protein
MRGIDFVGGFVAARSAMSWCPAGGLAVTTMSMPGGTAASIARAKAWPLAANTRPGVRISMIDFSLPKSLDISE